MNLDRRHIIAGATILMTGGHAMAQDKPAIDAGTAFLVIDVQNDFCKGGSLAVPDGDAVVAPINALAKKFSAIVLTQDWHTPGHASFASSHAGKKPFEVIEMPYGPQVLWPDHCIQGTKGAEFHPAMDIPTAQTIIRKGYRKPVDSYSGFLEADRKTPTGLTAYLKERGITRVVLAGLATDFCVNWTATDARKAGLETWVVEDACRAIDANGSLAKAWEAMTAAGVKRIKTADIPA